MQHLGSPARAQQSEGAAGFSGCPFAQIVKQTAPVVAPKVRAIVDDFYPRMFKNNPETKAFFNPANQFADPPLQRMALANAVVAYASNIDDLSALGDDVQVIAHKHCGLSVMPEHYGIVHKNLMEAIGATLGDAVTPEIGNGWSEAVLALAKLLYETEESLYKMAEQRAGGWRGKKGFKISQIRKVTEDCSEFTFKPAEGGGPIDFTPGQFLTLHLPVEGATPRHYTVTNAPGKDYLQCCVKKIPGGFVSNALHSMAVGDSVELAPPYGVFHMQEKPAVLISAGIGATPMKSFMDSTPAERVRLLMHIDKSATAHPFKAEMEASGISTHFHYTDSQGRPTPESLIEGPLKPHIADCDFYLCGPRPFLETMKPALLGAGAKSLKLDVFGPELSVA